MELREVKSLLTLAERGSFADAAAALHLSPATVHKHVKNLEAELDVRFYEKVGRGLQLTQAAEVARPHLKALLAEHESAISALAQWKGLQTGRVRIGAGPTLSSYVLPPLLRKFRRRFPKIDLLVETGNSQTLLDNLDNGTLDLALLIWPGREEPELSVARLWTFEIVLVANNRHALKRCSLADLKGFPFILFKQGSRVENLIERYLGGLNFEPNVIMRFDNAEAIKAMIRAGLGISMLPFWIVDADLKERRLSLVRQHEPPLFSKIALVSRKSSYAPKCVGAFVELARGFESRNPRLSTRTTFN